MFPIRTILCPVGLGDGEVSERVRRDEVALAAELCRSFDARLVLHHNLGSAPPGASMSWMWHQEHPNGSCGEDKAVEHLNELMASLPPGIEAEAHLSAGLSGPAIVEMEERVGADLVVMTTHGAGDDDHASVSEQVVERSHCPVLVLREDAGASALHFRPAGGELPRELPPALLVATDFTAASAPALAYAFELARTLPARLHLLHVVTYGRSLMVESGVPVTVPEEHYLAVDRARAELESLVPLDLEHQVELHVEVGDPAALIAEVASRLGVVCIVMGAHARGLLRRIFTRDTSRAVLHRASCPVWFVPELPGTAAAPPLL